MSFRSSPPRKPEVVPNEPPTAVLEAMKQNERILAMNERIIEAFCVSPLVYMPLDDENDPDRHRQPVNG